MIRARVVLSALAVALCAGTASAQERPYFVTYDHYLEEPGNMEVAVNTTTGFPRNRNAGYFAPWLEVEYGLSGWWTTEFYLEGVTTASEGSGYTGWRWENRLRPLKGEHRINPVFYVEFEHVNEASRIQKELVGSGGLEFEPIAELRREVANELEGKLILSSAVRGWNVAENFTVEKNFSEDEGLEFGYSVGVSRSLASLASGSACRFCKENFVLGVEAYGALGSSEERGFRETRHYLAPVLAWHFTDRATLRLSEAIGLTNVSDRHLLRVGVAYEFSTR